LGIFKKIKESCDIESVVEDILGAQKGRGNTKDTYLCPFHSENTASFHIYKNTNSAYCYGCEVGGDVIALVAKQKNIRNYEAAIEIAERYNIKLPEIKPEEKKHYQRKDSAYKWLNWYCVLANAEIKKQREVMLYLQERGISETDIDKYKIGYVGKEFLLPKLEEGPRRDFANRIELLGYNQEHETYYDYFRDRIIIPVWNYGRIEFISGRQYPPENDQGPKYLHLRNSEFLKRPIAFKENLNKENCLVVEGIFDAICLIKSGLPAVALQGTASKDEIAESGKKPILLLDNDNPGNSKSYKLAKELKCDVGLLPDKGDVNDLYTSRGEEGFFEEIKTVINNKKSYLELAIENGTKEEAMDLISELESATDIDLYSNLLAKKHEVGKRAVNEDIKKIIANKQTMPDNEEKIINPLDEFNDEEIAEAKKLLNNPNLFQIIIDHIEESGYVGERINKQVLYLAFTSRKFDKAISCVIKGDSSGGKSSLVEAVLALFAY